MWCCFLLLLLLPLQILISAPFYHFFEFVPRIQKIVRIAKNEITLKRFITKQIFIFVYWDHFLSIFCSFYVRKQLFECLNHLPTVSKKDPKNIHLPAGPFIILILMQISFFNFSYAFVCAVSLYFCWVNYLSFNTIFHLNLFFFDQCW